MKKENRKNIFSVGAWEVVLIIVVLLVIAFFQGARNDADAENVVGEGGRVRTVQKTDTSSETNRAGIAVTKEEPAQSPITTGEVFSAKNPANSEDVTPALTSEFGEILDSVNDEAAGDVRDWLRIMKGTTTKDIEFKGDDGTSVTIPKGTNYVAFGLETTNFLSNYGAVAVVQLKEDMTEEDWEKLDEALDQLEALIKAEKQEKKRSEVSGSNSGLNEDGEDGEIDSGDVEEYAVPIATFAGFKKAGGDSYTTVRGQPSDANADWNTLKENSNVRHEKEINGKDIDT